VADGQGWALDGHTDALEAGREAGLLGIAAAQESSQPRVVQSVRSAYRRVLAMVQAIPGAIDRAEQWIYDQVAKLPE